MVDKRRTRSNGGYRQAADTGRRRTGVGGERPSSITYRVLLLLGLSILVAAPVLAQTDEVGIPLGTIPDAVQIEDLDGNAVDLGRWIGKQPALFQFWATWCPQCEALEPKMAAAHATYGDRVAFVAVSVAVNQSQRSIKRHLEKSPVPHTVLWDTRGRATRAFMAYTTSYVVVLDADGKVVYTGVGPDQDIDAAVRRAVSK